jgi:hypothetical protein
MHISLNHYSIFKELFAGRIAFLGQRQEEMIPAWTTYVKGP